jgi:Fic family protein
MIKYTSKLTFDFQTNQNVLNLISKIDSYKGTWNVIESSENSALKELKKIATIKSIGSSTRIEGVTLTDKEISELLKNIKIQELKTRDEQEVIGYYDTIQIIYDNYEEINLTENYIKQLHQNLLKYSDKDSRHRGKYKILSNKVVAKYPGGVEKVIFNTSEVHLVKKEIESLLSWTNNELEKKKIHPLIVISLFIYEFLSIHPFQDGNGRLSRLLTTLLLLKNEYFFVQYVSFENIIELSKKEYYQALMYCQKHRYTDKEEISKWILYFLGKLHELTLKLDKKYGYFKSAIGYLNKRQKEIKDFIETNQPVKVSDISDKFRKYSINTIKKDLQYMRREKVINSLGKARATVYLMANKNT